MIDKGPGRKRYLALASRRFVVPFRDVTASSMRCRILRGGALDVKRVARETASLRASNSALMSSAALMSCVRALYHVGLQ